MMYFAAFMSTLLIVSANVDINQRRTNWYETTIDVVRMTIGAWILITVINKY